jgi:hypothetical protein
MQEFKDNDRGFRDWRDSHPAGFIVNAQRQPHADYLMLHRASCSHLRSPNEPRNWTKHYIKFCSTDVEELNSWASRNVAGFHGLMPCSSCKP